MNPIACPHCSGTTMICGHGFPYRECPGPSDNKCWQPRTCAECNSKGYIIPKVSWQVTYQQSESEQLRKHLDDGWEPFSILQTSTYDWIYLKKAIIKE